jgi:hypothetical protein
MLINQANLKPVKPRKSNTPVKMDTTLHAPIVWQ